MKNVDWKNLIERAFWTFIEAFVVAIPATLSFEMSWKSFFTGILLPAIAAGISAVKTLIVDTFFNKDTDDDEDDVEPEPEPDPEPALIFKKIYLSPSGQYGNTYAAGNTTEGVQCVKISKACEAALIAHGFTVSNGADKDYAVRYAEAKELAPDLYIPIHTNAFNGVVSGTRMFVRSFDDAASYGLCKAIFNRLDACCPGASSNIKEVSNLEELNVMNGYGINACYAECDFHDVPSVAEFIIAHTTEIGESIAQGICDYFGVAW